MKVAMFLFFFLVCWQSLLKLLSNKNVPTIGQKQSLGLYVHSPFAFTRLDFLKNIYIYHTLIIVFTSLYNNLCDKYIQMKEVKMSNVHNNKYNFVFWFCV